MTFVRFDARGTKLKPTYVTEVCVTMKIGKGGGGGGGRERCALNPCNHLIDSDPSLTDSSAGGQW